MRTYPEQQWKLEKVEKLVRDFSKTGNDWGKRLGKDVAVSEILGDQ